MHYNTGYHDEARVLMWRFVEVFRDAEIICVPSASCVAMLRDHYPKMAAGTGDAALQSAVAEILARTFEFSELLVDRLRVTDVGASCPARVTYHASCHSLRSLGLRDQPLRLLQAVRGLELVALPRADECCGFGGTFAVKNAEVSSAMAADKMAAVLETGAQICAAADNSCLLQIGGVLGRSGADVQCLHLAEILAESKA
jgi:L-lactate dehydrogenase complex protein LldE